MSKRSTILLGAGLIAIFIVLSLQRPREEVAVLQPVLSTTDMSNAPILAPVEPIEVSPSTKTITAKIGQVISLSRVRGTIVSVLEDSRCPQNVQCIQAGTVRIKIRTVYGSRSQDIILSLDKTYTLNGHSITLIEVKPDTVTGSLIAPEDYLFTFSLK